MEHEGELIWLRQSATFTVNGQTRTVEIAVPVRPDASAEEVEALMSQADMGMDALTRQLDTRIAALLAGEEEHAIATDMAHAHAAAPSAAPVATPVAQVAQVAQVAATPSAEPAHGAQRASAQPAQSVPTPAAISASEVPSQAARSAPPAPARTQQPQTARAGASSEPLSAQPPAAAQQPTRPTAPAPAPQKAAAAPVGPDISRAEFISATAEMGLNPAQAMERLGVRSLQGLNLREALEALRRQLVRDGGDIDTAPAPATPPARGSRPAQATQATRAAMTSAPAAPPAPAPAPAPALRAAAQPQPPRYFEEEDELDGPEFTFTMDGDEDGSAYDEFGKAVGEEAAGYGAESMNGAASEPDEFGALDDLDDFELDDVPDFGPPPAPVRAAPPARTAAAAPTTPPAPATARRGAAARASAAESREEAAPAQAPAPEGRSLGMQRVGQFRAVRGGGAPTGQQRMAYRNIIVRELGDADARALAQGLWHMTPDRLGGEQLDALVSWGKRDTFAEEAALVLAVLQEERERNDNAAGAADTPEGAAPSRTTPRARGTDAAAPAPRPAARPRGGSPRQAGDA